MHAVQIFVTCIAVDEQLIIG